MDQTLSTCPYRRQKCSLLGRLNYIMVYSVNGFVMFGTLGR